MGFRIVIYSIRIAYVHMYFNRMLKTFSLRAVFHSTKWKSLFLGPRISAFLLFFNTIHVCMFLTWQNINMSFTFTTHKTDKTTEFNFTYTYMLVYTYMLYALHSLWIETSVMLWTTKGQRKANFEIWIGRKVEISFLWVKLKWKSFYSRFACETIEKVIYINRKPQFHQIFLFFVYVWAVLYYITVL